MIQDIFPQKLDNQYSSRTNPTADSILCAFRGSEILLRIIGDTIELPKLSEMRGQIGETTYLFNIDGTAYFLADYAGDLPEGYGYANVRAQRRMQPLKTVYACMTALHLAIWYRDNRFCGRCGHRTMHGARLRMLSCPECGNTIFPKICPAIIVGVTHGDRILLTKYAGRAYKNYALIAGFCEIGETAEDTVRREVMEEAGVHVRNIRYFATQPWGVDCDLLIGYFADLDGDDAITMDTEELSLAGWYARDAMETPADTVSLTNTMISAFIDGTYPK